jgi:DNA-binding Xre family transcriptional regulator
MEGKFRFTLKETLKDIDENLTRNKLAVEAKVRPATIADIVNGESKRIELDTLKRILDVLNKMSDTREITIEDVIVYERK